MYDKNVKKTFEILSSEITFLMDLYICLLLLATRVLYFLGFSSFLQIYMNKHAPLRWAKIYFV